MDEVLVFPSYTHIYSRVGAYQLTPENRKNICLALLQELRDGKLMHLSYTGPNVSRPNASIVFRYMDETTDSMLNGGDYLVQLPTKRYVSMTADEFEEYYQESEDEYPLTDPPLVGRARADVSVLLN